MYLFYSPVPVKEFNILGEEESWHCTRVLRLVAGGIIHLADGIGNLYECVIVNADPKKCIVKVISSRKEYLKRNNYLHIGIAPTKSTDRFEWFLEKATEIGIDEITPILCVHSERIRLKIDRMQKILISAMKQSLKAYLPKLNEPSDFKRLVARHFQVRNLLDTVNPERKMNSKNLSERSKCTGPDSDLKVIFPRMKSIFQKKRSLFQ